MNGDRSRFDIDRFIIAKNNDMIIGCVRIKVLNSKALELSALVVLPEYQHQGIGSELVKRLLKKEQQRPIFLLTSSDKEQFYNRFGFFLLNQDQIPAEFKKEYLRVANLPFAKNIKVIAMKI